MIPEGMSREEFASIVCQVTLAVEAVIYSGRYN